MWLHHYCALCVCVAASVLGPVCVNNAQYDASPHLNDPVPLSMSCSHFDVHIQGKYMYINYSGKHQSLMAFEVLGIPNMLRAQLSLRRRIVTSRNSPNRNPQLILICT